MKEYSPNGRYARRARVAVANFLQGLGDQPTSLWSCCCRADEAARGIGAKHDLFDSLFDYGVLLPGEYTYSWLTQGADDTRMVFVYKRGLDLSKHRSNSLAMGGAGPLRHPGTPVHTVEGWTNAGRAV